LGQVADHSQIRIGHRLVEADVSLEPPGALLLVGLH